MGKPLEIIETYGKDMGKSTTNGGVERGKSHKPEVTSWCENQDELRHLDVFDNQVRIL